MARRIPESRSYTFTPEAQACLAFAQDEAMERGHDRVDTQHLLFGLLADPSGVAQKILALVTGAPKSLAEALDGLLSEASASPRAGMPTYTPQAKKAIELAIRETAARGDERVDTQHLLVGLADEELGAAAQVLKAFKATAYRQRRLRWWLVGRIDPAMVFRPVVDRRAATPLYGQIIEQVREAVATGLLRPGDRLPSIRRTAASLDVAPGTVAQAYRHLEALDVIRTEVGSGSHVAPRPPGALHPGSRIDQLVRLLRRVAVSAHHLGATRAELETALDQAMAGIFDPDPGPAG